MSTQCLEYSRRLERRYYARISFGIIVLASLLIILALVFGEDKTQIAEALATASNIIGSLFGTLAIIVLGYMGVSVTERIHRKD